MSDESGSLYLYPFSSEDAFLPHAFRRNGEGNVFTGGGGGSEGNPIQPMIGGAGGDTDQSGRHVCQSYLFFTLYFFLVKKSFLITIFCEIFEDCNLYN